MKRGFAGAGGRRTANQVRYEWVLTSGSALNVNLIDLTDWLGLSHPAEPSLELSLPTMLPPLPVGSQAGTSVSAPQLVGLFAVTLQKLNGTFDARPRRWLPVSSAPFALLA